MQSRHLPLITELFRDYDQKALAAQGSAEAVAKPDGSAVTRLDHEVSRHVVQALRQHTPDYGIISEEEHEAYLPEAEWKWVIDPLDGTASFARGYPIWGLGIGLLQGDQPREGFMRFPALNETFIGVAGRRYLNGREVPAAPPGAPPPLEDLRNVLTGSPLHAELPYQRLSGVKLRSLGSNLYHLACLAVGRAEAMLSPASYLWDLVPALPLTRAAGMVEIYVDGSPFSLAELIAARATGYRMRMPMLIGPPREVDMLLRRLRG